MNDELKSASLIVMNAMILAGVTVDIKINGVSVSVSFDDDGRLIDGNGDHFRVDISDFVLACKDINETYLMGLAVQAQNASR